MSSYFGSAHRQYCNHMSGRAQDLNLLGKGGLCGVLGVSDAVLALLSLLQELSHPGAASEFVKPVKRPSCLALV